MIAILATAVMGSWTYAGFLTEPSPTPSPTPPPASTPSEPKKTEKKPEGASPRASADSAKVPVNLPSAPAASIATPPTRYRLTDASGQAWEHADPAYLSSFVEARNRSFVTRFSSSPATFTDSPARGYRSSRCSNGRCN